MKLNPHGRAESWRAGPSPGRLARAVGVWGAGVIVAMGMSTSALAQSDQPSLDELLDLAPAQEQEQQDEGREQPADEADSPDDDALEAAIERELSADQAADAFTQAVREMATVAERLGGEQDAGIETQRMQQRILDRLDQVIAAARQQQSQAGGGGGSSGQQNDPQQQDSGGAQVAQQQSGAQSGEADSASQANGNALHAGGASPGEATDAEASARSLRELRREWGSLPPRLRDEIAEGMNERFSPVYRSLTEAYYQQLAEEE